MKSQKVKFGGRIYDSLKDLISRRSHLNYHQVQKRIKRGQNVAQAIAFDKHDHEAFQVKYLYSLGYTYLEISDILGQNLTPRQIHTIIHS